MFVTNRRLIATLGFLIIALMLGICYFSYADSDTKTVDGASASANAIGYKYKQSNGYYIWTAWAGFSASLSANGRKEGDSVNGSYALTAYMPASGLKQASNTFTLKVKKKWGFLWLIGESKMGNIHRDQYGSSSNPGGYSKSKTTCGKAKTKLCKWP